MDVNQIADFLNNFKAGQIFLFIIGLFTVGKKIIEFSMKIYDKIKGIASKELKKAEEMSNIIDDIASLKNELASISADIADYKDNLDNKVDSILTKSDDGDTESINRITEIQESLLHIEPKLKLMEEKLSKVESQIEVLITSDVNYIQAYITDSYQKFVIQQHHIDLISLQNVESVYNRLLQETGLEDEFLSKLMQELRNLPTTKDTSAYDDKKEKKEGGND